MALPSDQLYASSAVHSDFEVGLDREKIIGLSLSFLSVELFLASTSEVEGPGSRYQIDATIADVYLVSAQDREKIIGLSFSLAILRTIFSSNTPPTPDTPITMVGFSFSTAAEKLVSASAF